MPASMQAKMAARGGAPEKSLGEQPNPGPGESPILTSTSREKQHTSKPQDYRGSALRELCDGYNSTTVMPRLPRPRSLSAFSSGNCFSSSQVRSSLFRQFSP